MGDSRGERSEKQATPRRHLRSGAVRRGRGAGSIRRPARGQALREQLESEKGSAERGVRLKGPASSSPVLRQQLLKLPPQGDLGPVARHAGGLWLAETAAALSARWPWIQPGALLRARQKLPPLHCPPPQCTQFCCPVPPADQPITPKHHVLRCTRA